MMFARGIFLHVMQWTIPMGLFCSCKSECEESACAIENPTIETSDFIVELHEDSFAHVVVDGRGATGAVSGRVAFAASESGCVASLDSPCTMVLKQLEIEFGPFEQPTEDGTVKVDAPILAIETPLSLTDEGAGFVLPEATTIQSCAVVDGRSEADRHVLVEAASMNVDIENEGFSLVGTFPFEFHVGDGSCEAVEATVTVTAGGKHPWTQNPS